jgi:hypothetical protein
LEDFHFGYFVAVCITDPNLIKLISPIHTQIVSLQLLFLLGGIVPISIALNGRFALYQSSQGQLSIEPLAPFSRWSGQSRRDPRWIGGERSSYQQALEIGLHKIT